MIRKLGNLIKDLWIFIKKLIKIVIREIKELGWFWGAIAILTALIIFYSPTIVAFILYLVTNRHAYLTFAVGYATWWFLPVGSPGAEVYLVILLFVIKIIKVIRKRR